MIKFYEKRYIYFIISLTVMIIGVAFIFINGISLDIQFKGGAILKYSFTGDIDADSVKDIVESSIQRDLTVDIQSDVDSQDKYFSLNFTGNNALTVEQQTALEEALNKAFPDQNISLESSNIVEPFIGERFLKRGIIAIALASILIVIYVAIRFKRISGWSAGVMALMALFHDCLIVFFTFVVFQIPINDQFIAVLLTIIGFSVNDTIVIYDRIRENTLKSDGEPIEILVNKSITQSMTRSINTTVATIISILVVYIFAQINNLDSIISFSLPMIFGLVSGSYSTICLAGPLWVMWQKFKERRQLAKAK